LIKRLDFLKTGTVVKTFNAKDGRKVILRTPKWEDLDDLMELTNSLVEEDADIHRIEKVTKEQETDWLGSWLAKIEKRQLFCLVAEVDGDIVGFTLGKIQKTPPILQIEEFGHLSDTFVKEEYRRKRIGEKLTYELLEWFKSKGIKRVELSVDVRNKIGVSAWTKFGFEPFHYRMKKKPLKGAIA